MARPDKFVKQIYQPLIKPTLEEYQLKTDFMAWHKPRKHYLRLYQWAEQIRALIKRLKYHEGDTLSYLGMPGPDLLDIRSLHGMCERAKVKLKYIGFDSSLDVPGYDMDLSRHEVYSLEFIDSSSKVVKDHIQQIAIPNSMAYKTSSDYAPYDVINLDLTDSLAAKPQAADGRGTYFNALKILFDLQVSGRTAPWLLFLTTRSGREEIDPAVKEKLLKCIMNNAKKNARFRARLQADLGLSERAIKAELDGTSPFAHPLMTKTFCLAIGKWMLEVMMSREPHLQTKMLKSYCYTVYGPSADMLSLAYLIEPVHQPRHDPTGVCSVELNAPAMPTLTEAQQAEDLLAGVLRLDDVDELLARDDSLRTKMAEKCAQLLQAARYHVEAYMLWAQGNAV